jgi:hypothetical protein
MAFEIAVTWVNAVALIRACKVALLPPKHSGWLETIYPAPLKSFAET